MNWKQLLSTQRLHGQPDQTTSPRSAFERDWDRIVFSWPFRRMQDKTQVFPLASSDYVRTRLTHTIEVASVGRSLGTLAGEWIHESDKSVDPGSLSGATAAACLAHDIGNPPFGHSGEDAIQTWFKTSPVGQSVRHSMTREQARDIEVFEGNAQAFRLLSRLEYDGSGLQLTHGTLAAFAKYPRGSSAADLPRRAFFKKHGFHLAEAELFSEVATGTGLKQLADNAWSRHPLAYLVEAADDICYRVVDIEDAVYTKILKLEEVEDMLLGLEPNAAKRAATAEKLSKLDTLRGKLEYLRAKAINAMIFSAFDSFKEYYDKLMDGEFEQDLLSTSRVANPVQQLRDTARSKIYTKSSIVSIELAGYEVIGGLLDAFVGAATRRSSGLATKRDNLTLNLLSTRATTVLDEAKSEYERVLKVIDFVSGMTDSYALDLFRRIRGIAVHDGGAI